MQPHRILVIEDEADILDLMIYNLGREGYRATGCREGLDGLRLARQGNPDLILLDLMLPGLDGIEVCRKLKAEATTRRIPIIMVTAKGEESDIVLGLGVGADDYVTKPFSPKELLARVRAVLRRGALTEDSANSEQMILVTGTSGTGVKIDPARHEVSVDGKEVVFTATEFRLLQFLAANPGRVFTRDVLVTRVIGDEAYVIDRNIDVHIRALRKKLGAHRELIETIRGVGYRFRDKGL